MTETTKRPIRDLIVAQVPDRYNDDVEGLRAPMFTAMNRLAISRIVAQYRDHQPQPELHDLSIDWVVTDKPADVDEFEPLCGCATCRGGVQKGRDFLVQNPGQHIAMGNIAYVEVWRDA
jgi:hypothetical protein